MTYKPTNPELVKCGSGYQTKSHDSLKISNGIVALVQQGIGGKTALDYLIHVKGMDFVPAVQTLCGTRAVTRRHWNRMRAILSDSRRVP
jgi:hypothetical protein